MSTILFDFQSSIEFLAQKLANPKLLVPLFVIACLKKAVDVRYAFQQPHIRRHGHSMLERFITFLVINFGGNTLLGLILGQGPMWMTDPIYFARATACWSLLEFFPFDIPTLMFRFPPIRAMMVAVTLLTDAITIIASVKAAWSAQHEHLRSFTTMFICGVIGGTGGGITAQLFDLLGTWRFKRSDILRTQAIHLRYAILVAFITASLFAFAAPPYSSTSTSPTTFNVTAISIPLTTAATNAKVMSQRVYQEVTYQLKGTPIMQYIDRSLGISGTALTTLYNQVTDCSTYSPLPRQAFCPEIRSILASVIPYLYTLVTSTDAPAALLLFFLQMIYVIPVLSYYLLHGYAFYVPVPPPDTVSSTTPSYSVTSPNASSASPNQAVLDSNSKGNNIASVKSPSRSSISPNKASSVPRSDSTSTVVEDSDGEDIDYVKVGLRKRKSAEPSRITTSPPKPTPSSSSSISQSTPTTNKKASASTPNSASGKSKRH